MCTRIASCKTRAGSVMTAPQASVDEDDRISRGQTQITESMLGIRHTTQLMHIRGRSASMDICFCACDVRPLIILAPSSREWLGLPVLMACV